MTRPALPLALFALLAACKQGDVAVDKFNTDPTARITSPADRSVFDEGATVVFTGVVSDEQDDPSTLVVTWSSDLDPAFTATSTPDGEGNIELATSQLIPGNHTIGLHVVDSAETTADAYVAIGITDLEEAPTVAFVHPISGEYGIEGDPFEFKVQASDLQDDPADLTVVLTSDADGEFCTIALAADGFGTCDAVLSVGEHNLVATVTDTAGNTGAAKAFYQVVADAKIDADGDGWTPAQGDCNDSNDAVHPGATEVDNDVDDDCDGTADEDTYAWDDDGDCGCEAPACDGSVNEECTELTGYDCDDTDDTVYRGAPESCNEIDDDCDGDVDEAGAVDATTWYRDADSDTFGDPATTTATCTIPAGYVDNASDCNDATAAVSPAATEACNGVDDDCDGATDEAGSTGETTWYYDVDGDGYGDPAVTTSACTMPAGYVANSSDCNDRDANVRPGADERCNGIDDDCDGATDEAGAVDATVWYLDADSDGYGGASSTTVACTAPAGYTATATDCNDGNAGINPGAAEVCDGVDQDCDGSVDEGALITFYRDADGDGYGTSATTVSGCSAPAGYVSNADDCDDTDATLSPETVWYADADGDGYGDLASTRVQCTRPYGYRDDATDCDDTSRAINPGATERCDSIDNDCDGTVDETGASGCTTYYADNDGDGYGSSTSACLCAPSGAYDVTNSSDCYDSNPNAYPGSSTASTSSRGDGSYDYNCDGSQTKQYTTIYACASDSVCVGSYCVYTSCWADPQGWESSAPACGSSGSWVTDCYSNITSCGLSTTTRTQSCR